MKFIELVTARQSSRKFEDIPVEREKIERCLEAARLAPSASNSQPWFFRVIDDPEMRKKVALETISFPIRSNHFLTSAPVLVAVITGVPSLKMKIGGALQNRPYHLIDVGIATAHFCLQAVEEGLGTCMIGWLNSKAISGMLNILKDKRVEMLIAVGYSCEPVRKKVRKNIDEIRAYNLA